MATYISITRKSDDYEEKTRDMIDIADDGTMDTVVVYNGKLCESFELRYCSEFRFSFDNDEQFLDEIADEIADEVVLKLGIQGLLGRGDN